MTRQFMTSNSKNKFILDGNKIDITYPSGIKSTFEDDGNGYVFTDPEGNKTRMDYAEIIEMIVCYKLLNLNSSYVEEIIEGKVIDTFKIG